MMTYHGDAISIDRLIEKYGELVDTNSQTGGNGKK